MTGVSESMATVDELTGMLCSLNGSGGSAISALPGITGENGASSQGEANFARTLFATGFATFDPFYDGSTATSPGPPGSPDFV